MQIAVLISCLVVWIISTLGADQLYGHDILLDEHTVLFTEGTKAEIEEDGGRRWAQRFPLIHIEDSDTCEILGWTERAESRRVYDAFTFFNEIEVLKLRLETLKAEVDFFVIAESDKTHSNKPKPLYLAEALANVSTELRARVVRVAVEDMPDSDDAWVLEHWQRNALVRGLGGARDRDLVFVSDVDEIPAPHVVRMLRTCEGWDESGPVQLYTRFYNFRFSLQFEAMWHHPQAAAAELVVRRGLSPQELRMARTRPSHVRIDDAGWHLSFFADPAGIAHKMRAYAHQEYNRAELLNESRIAEALRLGQDYFYNVAKSGESRFGTLVSIPTCAGLPGPVLASPSEYVAWLPPCHPLAEPQDQNAATAEETEVEYAKRVRTEL